MSRSRLCRTFLSVGVILVPVIPVEGHDFFLILDPFNPEPAEPVAVRMHVSDVFAGEPTTWRSDRVVKAAWVGPHGRVDLTEQAGSVKPDALEMIVRPDTPGTYLFALQTSASRIELESGAFNEYLTHEGHDDLLKKRRSSAETRPAREKYTRFVKAVCATAGLRHGAKTAHVTEPIGLKIEIVPGVCPTSLRAGSKLPVQVLYDGKPLSGVLVSATYDGHTQEHDHYACSARTDGDGLVKIPLTQAGVWLVRVTHMIEPPEDADADYESFWAALTFEISDERP